MRRLGFIVTVFLVFAGCKQSSPIASSAPITKTITAADLSAMADAVSSTGPREGNNYKVFMLVLRQDQRPAAGFPVDMWVKDKSQPVTKTTDDAGLVKFEDLPFPDGKHPLNTVLHYFKGTNDQAREITYPYIESDAYRLKDTQYIPNTVTPTPQ